MGALVFPTLKNISDGVGNLLPRNIIMLNYIKKRESIFRFLTAAGSEPARWDCEWAKMRLVCS